jgi:hypothetical protein
MPSGDVGEEVDEGARGRRGTDAIEGSLGGGGGDRHGGEQYSAEGNTPEWRGWFTARSPEGRTLLRIAL